MDQPNTLQVVRSVSGHNIRIAARQWTHVVEVHDYMAGNMDLVLETIADPDVVLKGTHGEVLALRQYGKTNISTKTTVVVYRDEEDGFMITAFLTSRPDKVQRKREVVWKRPS
jgi:hypothetical protein